MVSLDFKGIPFGEYFEGLDYCVWVKQLICSKLAWNPPPSGFIRLNFDGWSLGNPGQFGIGCIFRDCKGKVVFVFSLFAREGFALKVELLAIWRV